MVEGMETPFSPPDISSAHTMHTHVVTHNTHSSTHTALRNKAFVGLFLPEGKVATWIPKDY